MIIKNLLTVLLAGSFNILSAQPQLPKEVTAKMPCTLDKGLLQQRVLEHVFRIGSNWGQENTIEHFRIAWSDRD